MINDALHLIHTNVNADSLY